MATVGMTIWSTVDSQTGFTPTFLMFGREVLHPIDLMLNPGVEEDRETPGTYTARHQEAMRTAHLNDARRWIMICVWKKENTLYVMRFINLTGLLCWDKVKQLQPFDRVPGL